MSTIRIYFVLLLLFSLKTMVVAQGDTIATVDTIKVDPLALIKAEIADTNYSSALALCDSILSENPDFYDVRLQKAAIFIRTGATDKALTELIYVTSQQPSYKEAWYLMGHIAFWNGDNLLAISHYDKAADTVYLEDMWLNKGTAYYNIDDIKNAEPLIDTVLSKNLQQAQALYVKDMINLAKANALYNDKKYVEAIPSFKKYLPKYASDNDTRYKLSRSYFETGVGDTAKMHLDTILKADSMHYDALMLLQIISLSQNYLEEALKVVNRLLVKTPNDKDLLIRKAQLLKLLKQYQPAYTVADTLYNRFPKDTIVLGLIHDIAPHVFPNTFTVAYNVDAFKAFKPYHFMYFQLKHKREKDVFVGRVNRAERHGFIGLQAEGEYYRSFEKSFIFLTLGASNSVLFPDLRYGAEYFHYFDKNTIELSGGFRTMQFDSVKITAYTFQANKYLRQLMVGYRHYVTPMTGTSYHTGIFTVRRYMNYGNFVGLQYINGYSPDDNYLFNSETYSLKSQSFRLEFFRKVSPVWSFQVNPMLTIEEYALFKRRQKFSFEIMINRLF